MALSESEELELRNELAILEPEELHKIYRTMVGYEEEPVSITSFLEDEEYLGELFPLVYPHLAESLQRIYPNPYYSPCSEIIIEGGIGTGKTTQAVLGSLYDVYKLTLLKRPQELFNLSVTTKIIFFVFSATLSLADDVVWGPLNECLINSPYFKDQLRTAKASGSKTLLPKNIHFKIGSRFSHALGGAVFTAILDEMNFQDKVADQAYKNYTAIERRQESRFVDQHGRVPGHMWLVSQTDSDTSFIEQHKKKKAKNKYTLVEKYTAWQAQASRGRVFSGEEFPVFIGSESRDPMILNKEEITSYPVELIEMIPIEMKEKFEFDVVGALMEIAGIATGRGHHKIYSSREKLNNQMSFQNYFKAEEIFLEFDDDKDTLDQYFKMEQYFRTRMHPDKPRCVHMDTGLTGDRFGIACGYLAKYTTVNRFDDINLEEREYKEPVIHIEWACAIKAKPGQEIPLFKVRMFLNLLRTHGVKFGVITTDGFQSADMRQILKKVGFKTEYLSVDKDAGPHVGLRNAIYENRCILPVHKLLGRELWDLLKVGKKIDHPTLASDGTTGSKDVADGAAGVYTAAANMKLKTSDMIASIVTHAQKPSTDKQVYDQIKKQGIPVK